MSVALFLSSRSMFSYRGNITMAASHLSFFHPFIQQWFSEKVGTPTDVQEKAWPEIVKGRGTCPHEEFIDKCT
jgi:hypothetical protein